MEWARDMQHNSGRGYPVKRMDISINMEKTDAHIKHAIKETGYPMHEIMVITGITTEQTIYKCNSGKSIPSLETPIILCRLLELRITELLVIDGELDFYDSFALSKESDEHIEIEFTERVKPEMSASMRTAAYYQALLRIAS